MIYIGEYNFFRKTSGCIDFCLSFQSYEWSKSAWPSTLSLPSPPFPKLAKLSEQDKPAVTQSLF